MKKTETLKPGKTIEKNTLLTMNKKKRTQSNVFSMLQEGKITQREASKSWNGFGPQFTKKLLGTVHEFL